MAKTVHLKYENYVSDNWVEGKAFNQYVDTGTYVGNSNWEEGCKELANHMHKYSDTVFKIVHDSPDYKDNEQLASITANSVKLTAEYTNGLVKYVKDW